MLNYFLSSIIDGQFKLDNMKLASGRSFIQTVYVFIVWLHGSDVPVIDLLLSNQWGKYNWPTHYSYISLYSSRECGVTAQIDFLLTERKRISFSYTVQVFAILATLS